MSKPKVFISHITEERQLAEVIKAQISKDFLGMLDVFVSSDQVSIAVGSKWLIEIDEALKSAQIELILCSHDSVKRPWVNFEAGAGWVKGIPVVPVCHTGMRPVDLPIPLNMLQGIAASDQAGWAKVYQLLASNLGCALPTTDFSELLRGASIFEQDYGLVRVVSMAVHALIKLLPELEQVFRPDSVHRSAAGDVKDIVLDKMMPHLEELQAKSMLSFALGNNKLTFIGPVRGHVVELKVEINDAYYSLASRVMHT
jgi:TIR domain